MSGRAPKVLLVTGFGRFPGAPFNPTQKIVAALGGDFARRLARLGWRLERRILPVDWSRLPTELARIETDLRPDAILHLGLAGRRRVVTVETRAANRRRYSLDAAGRRPDGPLIDAASPPLRSAGAWPPRLVAAMSQATPTRISHDAGGYLCNLTLWQSLARRDRPSLFVHVPSPKRPFHPGHRTTGRQRRGNPSTTQLVAVARLAALRLARFGSNNF